MEIYALHLVTVREDVRDSQGCSHALLRTLSKQTPASGSYFLQVGYEPVCLKSRSLRTEQRLPLARQSQTLVLRAGPYVINMYVYLTNYIFTNILIVERENGVAGLSNTTIVSDFFSVSYSPSPPSFPLFHTNISFPIS